MSEEISLHPENAHSFWEGAWKSNHTGWKNFEKDHSVFDTNIHAVESTLSKYPDFAHVAKDMLRSRQAVLIPLCGDTYATRYCVDGLLGGAHDDQSSLVQLSGDPSFPKSIENCRVVMGMDVAESGIQLNIKNNFPNIKFEVLDEPDHKFTHYVARVKSATDKETNVYADIHLFAGDFFEVCSYWKEKSISPPSSSSSWLYRLFDFCYDRASMVALHPSLRQEYVVGIVSIMTPTVAANPHSPIVFLELVVRTTDDQQERAKGPPFHIEEDTVAKPADAKVIPEDPATAIPTYYPLPWRRLTISGERDSQEPRLKFKSHVLFVDNTNQ